MRSRNSGSVCLWKWWDINTVLDETSQEEITLSDLVAGRNEIL